MDLKRDINEARVAFKSKDEKALVKAHSKHKEIHDISKGKYIKSSVYGGLDGIITTFAVVSGVVGAALAPSIILILGFANLIADGISMAIGDYLSTKSEKEYYKVEESREKWEVKNYPKGEKDEMIEIYQKKGLNKKDAKTLTGILSKNKRFWVETMMHNELGLMKSNKNPIKNGLVTFVSFLIFGFIPLSLYVLSTIFNFTINKGFLWTSILAGTAMFTLGVMKTKVTGRNWLRSGVETLLIGGLAAGAAYLVGWFLGGLF